MKTKNAETDIFSAIGFSCDVKLEGFWENDANDGREGRYLRSHNRYEDFLIGLIRLLLGVTLIPLIRLCVCVVCGELINSSRGCVNCVDWN